MSAKRNLRPRAASQYASQQEWNVDEEDVLSVRRFNAIEKFKEEKFNVDHGLVKEMRGEEFTLSYVQEHGLTQPLVFRDKDGLGMKLPAGDFSVQDVKRLVGPRRVVDVMDTKTQEASTMSLSQWTKYFTTKPRHRILNVISLEFSRTKMDSLIMPPNMVSQLDWVELMWPTELKELQTDPTNDLRRMMYPKVQKYCLMSVAGCYTDFHVDFGGTSVWYHVYKGEKLFLLIPPSLETYDMFQTWHMSGEQESTFFAELVSKAQLVKLNAGDTFIMPSGWIHAVYTPSDSLVFGGNFLHSFNIAQQLRVAAMENSTKVPSKFRYPFYGTMHWYVVEMYHRQLAKLGGAEGRSSPSLPCTEMEEEMGEEASKFLSSGSLINGKWLKEVKLKKVQVGAKKSVADSAESTALPFLSVYEKDGLLVLIQQMLKGDLFIPDAPPTLTNPKEVLRKLADLLQSSTIEKLCALRPTGVGVVSAPVVNRTRRTKGSTTPRKRRRKVEESVHGGGVKVQKKDTPTRKRKPALKKRQKPLLVSLPMSAITLDQLVGGALPGGSSADQHENNGNGVEVKLGCEVVGERNGGGIQLPPVSEQLPERNVSEKDDADEGLSSHTCEVRMVPQLLTPPLSLSSAESLSPSPSSSLPSSPCTPSSQSFSLFLELDSPLMSSSQTTPILPRQNQLIQNHAQNSTHITAPTTSTETEMTTITQFSM